MKKKDKQVKEYYKYSFEWIFINKDNMKNKLKKYIYINKHCKKKVLY